MLMGCMELWLLFGIACSAVQGCSQRLEGKDSAMLEGSHEFALVKGLFFLSGWSATVMRRVLM